MQFQQKDIFTRRERNKRVAVFVNQDWLIENLKGLTEKKLRTRHRNDFIHSVTGEKRKKQSVLPDTGKNWRYAKKNKTFYYDYDRLPNTRKSKLPFKTKEALLEAYNKCMKTDTLSSLEKDLLECLQDVTPYLKLYGAVNDIQAQRLATACAVVNFAAAEVSSKPPTCSNEYYRDMAAIIKKYNWSYVPANYRRFKEKVMQVVNGVDLTTVIRLPRKGVITRRPYDNKQVIGWMMYLRQCYENYSNSHIARRVIKMCEIARIDPPSFSWIEHYFSDNKSKWLTGAKRHRSGRRGADFKDYIPIAGATHAGDCWQMDGTRINFIPHKSDDGKERSLMIIAIRDVHSGDIVGFHLDTKEDRYGYIHALNMAVRATGHLPYELVHDRFPGHNTSEWELVTKRCQRQGTKVTVTSTATGKSHVERCFSTIQDVFMQDFPWYYGQGIQSTRVAGRRSAEYLMSAKKRARKQGWGFDEAWQAAAAVVHNYRTTKLNEYSRKNASVEHSPKELYELSDTPNVAEIDEFERVELFGTMRKATIRNNGLIRMQIHKAEYIYRIEDYEIIANYKKVYVYYDLEDLTKVYIFAPSSDVNSKFLCEVVEEKAIQYYGPNADMEGLAKAKAKRKAIRDKRQEDLDELIYGAKDEVDLLMTAVASKTTVDTAETRWLQQGIDIWKDKGEERRMPEPPEPVVIEEDEEEIDLQVLRNY